MFKNWGFLLGEIWVLILFAALLGLFVGWLIWGRRSSEKVYSSADYERLNSELNACRKSSRNYEDEIARLNWDLEAKQAMTPAPETVVEESDPSGIAESEAASDENTVDYDGDGVLEGPEEGVKPTTLEGPRDGAADDLKMIKGVGEKMERLCNSLGFYHFDQIANWTDQEVAWVDANLEGFKGRVSRDGWVEQAKLLASGGETEFSKRVKEGDVYE